MMTVLAVGLFLISLCHLASSFRHVNISLASVSCFGSCPPFFGRRCDPFDECCRSSIYINGTEFAGNDGVTAVAINASTGIVLSLSHLSSLDDVRDVSAIPAGALVMVVSQSACFDNLRAYYRELRKYLDDVRDYRPSRLMQSMMIVACRGKCPKHVPSSIRFSWGTYKGYLLHKFMLTLQDNRVMLPPTVLPTTALPTDHSMVSGNGTNKSPASHGSDTLSPAVIIVPCLIIVLVAAVACFCCRGRIALALKRQKSIKSNQNVENVAYTIADHATVRYEKQNPYMYLKEQDLNKVQSTYEPLNQPKEYENLDKSDGNIYSSLDDDAEKRATGRSAMAFSKCNSEASDNDKFASYIVSGDTSGLYKSPSNVKRRDAPCIPAPKVSTDRDSYVSMHCHEYEEPCTSPKDSPSSYLEEEYVSLGGNSAS